MKILIYFMRAGLFSLFLVSAVQAQLLSGGNLSVIKVGGVGISQGKVDSLVKQLAQAQAPGRNIPPETMTQLRWAVIDNLVGQELLKSEITKQGLKAEAKKVDSLTKLFKSQFPSEEIFKQELKKSGTTEAEFKKKIENQLLADQVLEKKIPYPKDPTDKEKKDYWEQHKHEAIISDSISGARIVLNIAKGENAQAIQDKKDILKGYAAQVRTKKANFASVAAQVSEDPNAKKDGGVMTRFLPKDQGAEFVNAIKNLKIGDISEPFVQNGKVAIFMLSEKNDGKYESYEYQIDYILRVEAERKRQLAIKDYLDLLAKTYKVQYLNKEYTPPEAIGM
jgi:parvulin-like peptidyl-prolyl isomerase